MLLLYPDDPLHKSRPSHDLHSTMLLLYPRGQLLTETFKRNLHSTMLLLYRFWFRRCQSLCTIYIPLCFYFIACTIRIVLSLTLFTFHYASTLSCLVSSIPRPPQWFTFHYASTLSYQVVNYGKMEFIYIPLCFYFIPSSRTAFWYSFRIYIPLCFYFIPAPP